MIVDAAELASNKIEKTLLKRIGEIYNEALKQAIKNNRAFLESVKMLDKKEKDLEKAGWTPGKIGKWKKEETNKLLREQRVVQRIAKELNDAGIPAAKEILDTMPEIYKTNRDYAVRKLSKDVTARFDIYDKRQIEILLKDTQPAFSKIAYKHLGSNPAIVRRLQNEMAQATVLGESQTKIVERIRKVTGQSEYQAKRVAQTERVRIQSQARYDGLKEGEAMGLDVTKEWSARMVNTRESHAALNGTVIKVSEKFQTIWGNELEYPGDPSAPAEEVINCHCVLIPGVR